MPLGRGDPHEGGGKKGAPSLKRRYFTGIGSSSVKTVADIGLAHTCCLPKQALTTS